MCHSERSEESKTLVLGQGVEPPYPLKAGMTAVVR